MEITFEGWSRRTAQPVRLDRTQKSGPAARSGTSAAEPKADRVSSTRQAVQRTVEQMQEQSRRLMSLVQQEQKNVKKEPAIWDLLDSVTGESGGTEAEMTGERLKTMQRCQKIAARIMRGDKVPPQDEQYLMENAPDGYKLALAMRTPKEWESVLKDDEKETPENDAEGDTQGTAS